MTSCLLKIVVDKKCDEGAQVWWESYFARVITFVSMILSADNSFEIFLTIVNRRVTTDDCKKT